jgi:uncharacterized protein
MFRSTVAQTPVVATVCEIQGSGAASPLLDQAVTTGGIVTANFLATGSNGFFIQHPSCDGDPRTSDGLWVYRPTEVASARVEVGDRITVTGEVAEYFEMTEVEASGVLTAGRVNPPMPEALDVPADPTAAADYLEAHEGMWVTLPPSRVIGPTDRYGEAYVVPAESGFTRLFWGVNDGRRIGLEPRGWWLRSDHGDVIDGVTGALAYRYGNFKVAMPIWVPLRVTPPHRQPPTAEPLGADAVTLASYNLEGFHDSCDSAIAPDDYRKMLGVRACGVANLLGNPDVIGVQEVENDRALTDLAHEIRARTLPFADPRVPGGSYAAAIVEHPPAQGMNVGFLYRRDRVQLVSTRIYTACTGLPNRDHLPRCTLEDGTDGRELYDRPPLLARFELVHTGGRFNVIVNHFKSMIGGEEETRSTRDAMAKHNLEIVHDLKQTEPAVPVFVMGDLNDRPASSPLATLTANGTLYDPHARVPPDDEYTYVFDGVSEVLDYILTEPDAWDGPSPLATDFRPLHINADYGSVPVSDLRGACTRGDQHERAVDHDPVILRLDARQLPGYAPNVVFRARIHLPIALDRGMPVPPERSATPTVTCRPTVLPAPTRTPTVPRPTATRSPTTPAPTPTGGPGTPTPECVAPPRSPVRIEEVFYNGTEGPAEPDEYVAITNVTGADVDLTDWVLVSTRGDQRFRFKRGITMSGGQRCRVYTNRDDAAHCSLSYGSASAIWRNTGDCAVLRDGAGEFVDRFCYGDMSGACPR